MKKLVFLSLLFLITPRVFAQQNSPKIDSLVKVSPIIFNVTLSPGVTYNETLEVTNLGSEPMPVRIAVDGFDSQDEDGGISMETSTTPPLVQWIHLDRPDELIAPHTTAKIPIKIEVPPTVGVGGYYAVIFLTPQTPVSQTTTSPVIPRIGVLMFASVGVPLDTDTRRAEILTADFRGVFENTQKIAGILRVKNTALSHFSAKPRLVVTSLGGQSQEIELAEKVILPGKIRRWDITEDIKIPWRGVYWVRVDVGTGGGIVESTTRTVVIAPWRLCIGLILLTVGVVCLTSFRRRIFKALRVMMGR